MTGAAALVPKRAQVSNKPTQEVLAMVESTNGSGLSWLDEMLLRATDEEAQLRDRRSELTAQVAGIDEQLRSITRIKKAAGAMPPPVTRPAKARKTTGMGLGPEKMDALLEVILAKPNGAKFSVRGTWNEMGRPGQDAGFYLAFQNLREREVIGRAGTEPGSQKGSTRDLYRLIDRDAAGKMREELRARAA